MTRRLGVWLLVAICSIALPSLPSLAEDAKPATVELTKSATPVVIDGALDDECWRKAVPIRVDYINSKQGVLSDKPRMVARYTWDEHYLYLAYETFDANLVAIADGQVQGPPGNRRPGCSIFQDGVKVDVVEFFLSFGDEQFFWEIHHNAANQFNDVWCVVAQKDSPLSRSSLAPYGIVFCSQEFMPDDGPETLATAVRMKAKADGTVSTVNDPSDTDSGYTAELRLPWLALSAPAEARGKSAAPDQGSGPWKMARRELQILAVVQDGDLAERYHHSSPTRNGDWFHKTQVLWPNYRLAE
jgi:Carbohydrate family 9 binding domain-like